MCAILRFTKIDSFRPSGYSRLRFDLFLDYLILHIINKMGFINCELWQTMGTQLTDKKKCFKKIIYVYVK